MKDSVDTSYWNVWIISSLPATAGLLSDCRHGLRQIMRKNSNGIAQIVNDLFPEDCLKQMYTMLSWNPQQNPDLQWIEEWNAAGMELPLLTPAEGMHSVNYVLDIWSSQSQVMTGFLLLASSRFRQGRASQQSRLLGRKGACKTAVATELSTRAVSVICSAKQLLPGSFSSFQKQQLLPL